LGRKRVKQIKSFKVNTMFKEGNLEINQPHYNNPTVVHILRTQGAFEYGNPDEFMLSQESIEKRPIVMLENGAKYEGEWVLNSQERGGRGVQIWADGSRYEGYWKENKANGIGRLIHADGDVY
jgi:hypothetical protein